MQTQSLTSAHRQRSSSAAPPFFKGVATAHPACSCACLLYHKSQKIRMYIRILNKNRNLSLNTKKGDTFYTVDPDQQKKKRETDEKIRELAIYLSTSNDLP
jgi:hypothetical protein